MRKTIVLTVMAVLALAGCSKNGTVVQEELREIRFSAVLDGMTKSTPYGIDGTILPTDYYLYVSASQYAADGTLENGAFIANKRFVYDNTEGCWIPANGEKLYWPAGNSTLDFVVFATHSGPDFFPNIGESAWDDPYNEDSYYDDNEVAQGFKDYYELKVDNLDNLYAVKNAQSTTSSAVTLHFFHFAPLLLFNVKESVSTGQIHIKDIGFYTQDYIDARNLNPYLTETKAQISVKMFGDFNLDNRKSSPSGYWSNLTNDSIYSSSFNCGGFIWANGGGTANACNSGVSNGLSEDYYNNDSSYYGPVSTTNLEYGSLFLPNQEQVDFTVQYCIGGVWDDNGTPGDCNDDSWAIEPTYHQYTYHVDRRARWEMGKKYIYNIEFNMNEISITPTVEDYTPGTTPNLI